MCVCREAGDLGAELYFVIMSRLSMLLGVDNLSTIVRIFQVFYVRTFLIRSGQNQCMISS